MTTTFKWAAPESLQPYFTTELNALANATFSALGAEINNEADLYEYINLELVLAAQAANRAAGATVEVWMVTAVDGATPNYEDSANAKFSSQYFGAFPLDDASLAARRLNLRNIPIPPLKFKLFVRNQTGQALAATTNTLKYRRHNEQGV